MCVCGGGGSWSRVVGRGNRSGGKGYKIGMGGGGGTELGVGVAGTWEGGKREKRKQWQ